MKFFESTTPKRVTNFALAALLFVSTITASVPFLFSEKASAVTASNVVYKGLPDTLPSTYPSLGFAATSTKEFGDRIVLDGSDRLLDDVTVNLTSWACQTGEWNLNNCVSAPNATFQHPVTVNIYEANSDGTVGSLIASKTQTINALYRPSADNTNCTGGNAGKWFDGTSCYNGKAFNATFDFSSLNKTVPSDVIATVAYNTQNYGAAPTGVAGPYDALNVSYVTSDPTVGTDLEPDTMYWDTTYPPYTTGLKLDTGYTGYHLGINVTATSLDAPTNGQPNNQFRTTASGWNYTWNSVAGATSYEYQASRNSAESNGVLSSVEWNNINNGDATQNNITTPSLPSVGTVDGTWYWQVRALGSYGTKSDWSSVWNVTVDTATPDKPTNFNPSNGSVQSSSLTFDWLDVANPTPGTATTYELQYSTSPSAAAGVLNGTVTTVDNIAVSQKSVTGLADGYIFWQVRAKDAAGNASAWSDIWGYQIDATAPTTPVAVAPTGTNQSASAFTWTASTDNVSNPVTYEVITGTSSHSLDNGKLTQGVIVKGTGLSGTSLPATFDDGTFFWQVQATDALGNKSPWSNIQAVTIDSVAPVAPVITNSPVTVNAAQANAQATWTHTGADVDHFEYREYMNALAAALDTPYWTPSVSKNDRSQTVGSSWGTHTLYYRVVAVDAAGNRSDPSELGTVIIDKELPVVAITSPAASSTIKGNVTVTGTVSDANLSVSYLTVTNNANGIQYAAQDMNTGLSNPSVAWNTASGPDGVYTIYLEAKDKTGNDDSTSITVTVDNNATTPTLATPTNGAEVKGATLTQSWTTPDTDIDHYVYESYNDEAKTSLRFTGNVSGTSKTATNVADATFWWRVKAVDAIGNESGWSTLWKLVVDNTAPAVTIADITPNAATITGTVTDANTTDVVEVTIDGTTTNATITGNIWSITTPALADGFYIVSAVAKDLATNTTSPAVTDTLKIDTVTPTVTITQPTITLINDATPTITGTYNDVDANDDTTILLFIDNNTTGVAVTKTANGDGTGTWTYTPAVALAEGAHTFVATATDAVDNDSASAELTLTIDTLSPAVTANGSVNGSTVTVTGTAEADAVLSATFNGVTGPLTNTNGSYTFTATNVANGTYTFSVTATDAAGNSTVQTTSVTVNVPPAFTGVFNNGAVLGATTDTDAAAAANNGDADVEGATTKTAAVDTDATDGSIFGLAWYWWLLILAALAGIAAWIIGAVRRRNNEEA